MNLALTKTGFVSLLLMTSFFCTIAQSGKPASLLFQEALSKAKVENKNVFLVLTASWCAPCRELKRGLHDAYNAPYLEKYYVFEEFHISETPAKKYLNNPGSDSLFKQYRGDSNYIPYWVILTSTGKKLHGQLDFNSAPESLRNFINVLKRTSKLTAGELEMIYDRFRQLSKLTRED